MAGPADSVPEACIDSEAYTGSAPVAYTGSGSCTDFALADLGSCTDSARAAYIDSALADLGSCTDSALAAYIDSALADFGSCTDSARVAYIDSAPAAYSDSVEPDLDRSTDPDQKADCPFTNPPT